MQQTSALLNKKRGDKNANPEGMNNYRLGVLKIIG
jgi:hypothetical protein